MRGVSSVGTLPDYVLPLLLTELQPSADESFFRQLGEGGAARVIIFRVGLRS